MTQQPMPADPRPFYVAGRPAYGEDSFEVRHPFDGELVARVSRPTAEQVEQAVVALDASRHVGARLTAADRAEALMHVSRRLAERADEVALLITAENGKPLKWARAEAGRAASVFRFAAEEARAVVRRGAAAGHRPGGRGPAGARPPLPQGPGAGHRAVQLPAEPGRAQGRPRARGRRPDPDQAGSRHAAVGAAAGRAARRDRAAGRDVVGLAGGQRGDAGARAGPEAADHLLHRLAGRGLPDHGRRPAQARDPRAGRQRGGDRGLGLVV